MNVILLSGGSGKRLWPLSNEVRSKQFLKIFRKEDGTKESMAQRMFRMIRKINPDAAVTIATSENQIPQIRAQMGDSVGISVEPMRRDTFPAIALAAAYLRKNGVSEDEPVVVCPVDPYVEEGYFRCLQRMSDKAAEANAANLLLMGIEPDHPSSKYGYIIPCSMDEVASVREFKEKPSEEQAERYIAQGALWNGGVFAFRLSYLLNIARTVLGTDDYSRLYSSYADLPRISFDYAVVEKEKSIQVIRYRGAWNDLGTWNILTEAMDEENTGDVTASGCTNTHVINELSIPLIAMGMKDCVIAATPDGILVSSKDATPELKRFVPDSRPMYERRRWGEYRVLDYKTNADGQNSLTKELILTPGEHISYQYHRYRTVVWVITGGTGKLVLDGALRTAERGDVIVIKAGMKHAVEAVTPLNIIEVQIGRELTEEDIERLDWDWNI